MRLLNRNNKALIHAAYLEHLREIWWFVSEGSSAENNRIYVLNLSEQRPVWSLRTGINASSSLVLENQLYTGSYTGHIFQQLSGNTYNTEAFDWSYKTPFYHLGSPANRKRLVAVDLYLSHLGNEGVTLKTVWDFSQKSAQVMTAKLSGPESTSSSVYGTSIYGNTTYGESFVSVELNEGILHFHPVGTGRYIQFELTGTMPGQSITVDGWRVSHIRGGRR